MEDESLVYSIVVSDSDDSPETSTTNCVERDLPQKPGTATIKIEPSDDEDSTYDEEQLADFSAFADNIKVEPTFDSNCPTTSLEKSINESIRKSVQSAEKIKLYRQRKGKISGNSSNKSGNSSDDDLVIKDEALNSGVESADCSDEDSFSSEGSPCSLSDLLELDVTEAAGNVDEILNTLGVQDSPLPSKKRKLTVERYYETVNDEILSERIVKMDGPVVESENGFEWDTEPPQTRKSVNPDGHCFKSRPTGKALEVLDPIDCFRLFFTNEMMDDIIRFTNDQIVSHNRNYSRKKEWNRRMLVVEEFSALLSLIILAGALRNNHLNTDKLFDSTLCGERYRATMNRSRFNFLISCLTFEEKNEVVMKQSIDKLIPIKRIWEMFIENCLQHYLPGSNVTIGRQIINFKGQCPFKFLTHSPVRHGMQVFLMVDNTSKYLINAMPYLGRDMFSNDPSLPSLVVKELVEPIKRTYRNVTIDDWFTSVKLAEDLLNRSKLTLIGQIKKNKKELPLDFVNHKFKRRKPGSSLFLFYDDVTAVSYKPCNNTGLMTIISTRHHGPTLRPASGKPDIIHDYEDTRKAVEIFDNNCMNINTSRKTNRWPVAFFYNMLNMAIQNSFTIYTHNFTSKQTDSKIKPLTKNDFVLHLVDQLSNAWIRNRLNSPLQPSLRSSIFRCLKIEESAHPKTLIETDPLILTVGSRRTCSFCHYTKRRKTKTSCCFCRKMICGEHSRKMCISCQESNLFLLQLQTVRQ